MRQRRNLDALGEVLEKTLGGKGSNGSNTSMVEKQAAYNFMSSIHDKLFDLMERVVGIQDPVLKKMYNDRIKETRKRLVAAEATYKKVYDENNDGSEDGSEDGGSKDGSSRVRSSGASSDGSDSMIDDSGYD